MEPDLRQLEFLADGLEPMADALGVCRGAIFFDGDIPGMIAPFVALGELLCALLRPEASQGVDRGLVEADGSGAFLGFGCCFVDGSAGDYSGVSNGEGSPVEVDVGPAKTAKFASTKPGSGCEVPDGVLAVV